MDLINVKDLCFSYNGKIAVDKLNFNVEDGDYLCIIGENGAGKSTLVKGLLNLNQPTKGKIHMNDILKLNEIGYLPQQTQIQKDFPADVFEIVLSGCLNKLKWRPFYTKKEKALANEKIEQLNLTDLKHRCYKELSGGQQQRVLLARALCSTKKLLILDEPSSGLDPLVTESLYELIYKINKEQKLTIIMISHDIPNVLKYSNKILHLQTKQLFFGTTKEYLNSSFEQKYFIGGNKND